MKQPHTNHNVLVIFEIPGKKKKCTHIPVKYLDKLETFLEKYSEDDEKPVAWEKLAGDRLARYRRSGLVLRGARYREGLTQKQLAEKSGISQENISKMENGTRTIGKAVAKKLASVLHISENLFL